MNKLENRQNEENELEHEFEDIIKGRGYYKRKEKHRLTFTCVRNALPTHIVNYCQLVEIQS